MLYDLNLSSNLRVPYKAKVSIVEFITFRSKFSLCSTFPVFRILDSGFLIPDAVFQILGKPQE